MHPKQIGLSNINFINLSKSTHSPDPFMPINKKTPVHYRKTKSSFIRGATKTTSNAYHTQYRSGLYKEHCTK
jgi:hypothetical protein